MAADQQPASRMDQRRQVALIVYPGFKTLEATGPLSVLGYASRHLAEAGHAGGYDVTIAAPDVGHIPSDTAMSLEATVALNGFDAPDTVLISGAAGSKRFCPGSGCWWIGAAKTGRDFAVAPPFVPRLSSSPRPVSWKGGAPPPIGITPKDCASAFRRSRWMPMRSLCRRGVCGPLRG